MKMDRRTFLKSTAVALSSAVLSGPSIVAAERQRVLKFVPLADLTILDPIFSTVYTTRNHGYMVFDTLFGRDSSFQIVPQMAEGASVDGNGLEWTIKLRPNLLFHDGERVLGRDCVASINRWAKRDAFGQTLLEATSELSAPDDRTIKFRLKSPFPLLTAALGKSASLMCAIMPERIALTDAMQQVTEMVGSGPFRFKSDERMSGARAVYEKFAGYKPSEVGGIGWTSGPKIVHFDRVEWHTIPDPATAAGALMSGEVQWVEYPLIDLLPTLRGSASVRVVTTDSTGLISTARMNGLQKPFDNPDIRRLVLSVINQKEFMEAMVGSDPDLYTTGVGVFCPNTPLANSAGMAAIGSTTDLERVKQDIRRAGYNGEKVVVLAGTDQPIVKVPSEVMADILQKLGFNVDLQTMEWGSVLRRRASKESVDKGGWSCFSTGWSGTDQLDPTNHIPLRGNGIWPGWIESKRLEDLRSKWFQAPNLATQKSIAEEMQRQALEIDVPYIPLGQFAQPTAHHKSITGLLPGFATFWNVKPA